jgi:hypothetical protein
MKSLVECWLRWLPLAQLQIQAVDTGGWEAQVIMTMVWREGTTMGFIACIFCLSLSENGDFILAAKSFTHFCIHMESREHPSHEHFTRLISSCYCGIWFRGKISISILFIFVYRVHKKKTMTGGAL